MKIKPLLTLVISSLLLISTHLASALDNGVDPFNLGKGDWIYYMSQATNKLGGHVTSVTNVASLMSYEKSQGMSYVAVKAGTGSTNFENQFTASLVNAAHNAGLKIFAYTRSYGTDIPGEIALATNCMNLGADGFIIDAEIEWESANLANNTTKATQLCTGIKAVYPTRFLGHSPFMYISSHSSFPWKQFGLYCDAVMPQAYWVEFGISAAECAADLDTQWNNWQKSLTGNWTNAIKPIAPAAEGWNGVSAAEITAFYDALKNTATPATRGGYKGINWWRADLHTATMWTAIGGNSIGIDPANTPIISNVGITQLGMNGVTVIWDTDQGGNSVVEYGLTASYGTSLTNTADAIAHAVTITGLESGVTYHYRVSTRNPNGVIAISDDYTFTTSLTVADIIVDNGSAAMVGTWSLASSATDKFGADYRYKGQGTGAAHLTFTPNILKAGPYRVYEWHPQGSNRSTATPYLISFDGGSTNIAINQQINGGKWNLLGTFDFKTGTTNYVRILDNNPDAGMLNMADAFKFAYALIPEAPVGVTLTVVGTSQIDISWSNVATNAESIIVSRSTFNGGPYTDIANLSADATSYSDIDLDSQTTYYYVIRARNSIGDSANTAQSSATTLPFAPDAATELTATAVSAIQINLAWTDNATNESKYVVARGEVSGGPYVDIANVAANSTGYSDTNLPFGTTYFYVVRAENLGGVSSNSAEASATTLAPPPAAPSDLNATAVSASQVNLSWTDNANDETSFTVSRATVSGGPYSPVATVGANTTSLSDTGLLSGATYYYVVRADNAGGPSANSAEAVSTTILAAPDAPTALTATAVSASQINLTWVDNAYNESNYIVARAETSGGPYADIATLGANAVSFSDSALNAYTAYYYVVRASNPAGDSAGTAQASATTLPTPPSITTQPASQTVSGGATVTFFVVAEGVGPFSYQWKFKGSNVSGATGTSYTRSNVGLADGGNYSVVVSNSGGSVTSSNALLTVNVPPSITTQPQNKAVASGSNATFSVTATGTTPLTYQWRYNNANISGATSSAYTRTNVRVADTGSYSVVVQNAFGSVTSTDAILSISSAVLMTDDFEAGLGNWGVYAAATNMTLSTAQNHTGGGSKSALCTNTLAKMYRNLSPVLSGKGKVTFWIYDSTQTRAFGETRAYSGGVYNSGSLRQIFGIGKYNSVSMTNEVYNSAKYQGRVYAGTNTGWFNLNATGAPNRSTGWHKFEIEVLGNGSTVKFYVDGVMSRQIDGVTYYPIDDLQIGSIGSGTTAGDAWFDDVKVEYYDGPAISSQPASQTVNAGATVTLNVGATGLMPTYQWLKDGVEIAGATQATFVLANAQASDAGVYSVQVANGISYVNSSNAVVTVNVGPMITTGPVSQTVNPGSSVSFTVTATGTAPLTYQWTFNGVNIAGATDSVYNKTNVEPGDAGEYAVIVSNAAGSQTSAPATLTVNVPPSITAQPVSQTVNQGSSASFSVSAEGTAPLSYQWTFNGVNIVGATTATLAKSNVQPGDVGDYAVVVSNIAGSVTSIAATLTVNVPPSITAQPQGQTVNQGDTLTLSVTAQGTAPLNYQWTFNGVDIAGATDSALIKNNVQPSDAGDYAVVVSNMAGSIGTAVAVVSVNVPPTIATQPASQTVDKGADVTFSVEAGGTAPLGYQWQFNGANISGATASVYSKANVQGSDAGNYSVIVTNMVGSVSSEAAVLTVNMPPTIASQPASQTVAAGSSASFSVAVTGDAPISYQWQFNGVAIAGATSSSYTVVNAQSSNVGYYSVNVSNPHGSVSSADAVLTLDQAVGFTDTFDSGNLNNWTVCVSPAASLDVSTTQHHSGTSSARLTNSLSKMYHNLAPVGRHAKVTFWMYDATGGGGTAGQTRWYGEARSYSGGAYNTGALNQLFAIGRYSLSFGTGTGTLAGEVLNTTNYQGRVISGANTGWFNLSGAANRSVGWHKFEIERLADGTTVNFYVDGALGRSITGVTYAPIDDVTIGSIGSGTGSAGDVWFDDVTVEYYESPVITAQPVSVSTNAGAHVALSVGAVGSVQTYQWRLNGANIVGATSSALVFSNVQANAAGSYSVIVANGVGVVTSTEAVLTVSPAAPYFTAQPSSQAVNAGNNVTFTVAASGTEPLSYQWTFDGVNIAGATGSSYTVENVQPSDAGVYAVIAVNSIGTTASANATLAVNVPAQIVSDPQSQTILQGEAIALSVTASGSDPLSYQWMFNGADITGATSSIYTKANAQPADAGSYSVKVSNIAGSATSANAVITVLVPPSISTQPANQTVVQGANVSFSVTASGTAPLTYQWKFNGADIPGATTSALSKANVQTADAGDYSVVVANAAGSVASVNAHLTVNVPPSITAQPISQTAAVGSNVSFSVSASGTAPLSYQWKFNGTNISGATASAYTRTSVQSAHAGSYSVLVSNVAGSVTSADAILTVNTPPTITTQPASQTVAQGSDVTFSVVASGTAPLSYQWKFNGADIAGATSTAMMRANVQPANAGTYTVVVSNAAGSVTSANAVLTVTTPPVITTQPVSQAVPAGSNATFTVTATGGAPLSYQWRFNGANISGATTTAYTRTNVQSATCGSYSVVVTNASGSVTSSNAILSLIARPTITTQPVSQSVAAGANVTFSVTASGSPLNYQWRKNGTAISGATASAYTIASAQTANAGTYSVVITNTAGSVTSSNATLTVNNPPTLSLGSARVAEPVVTFETMTNLNNDQIMFRRPANSSTTSAFIDTSKTNYTRLTTSFPSGNPNGCGAKALVAGWTFKTGTSNAWVRLNTTTPNYIPNPTFGFTGRIRFDIHANKAILLGIGMRETLTTNLATGANGGTTGNIEWIGVTNKTSTGSPKPVRSIAANTWTTVEFNLPAEACTAFNGNGVLDGVQGVLEELAIVPNGGLAAYTIYLDNFQMVTTNTLPTTVQMNSRSTLTFTAAGSDPDSGQTLTYSLVGAPTGASINSSTGAFTWMPTNASTSTITVRVADNGTPSQNTSQSFTVNVSNDPLGVMSDPISAMATAGETVVLTWSATPGSSYQVQYRQGQGEWINLDAPIAAEGAEASVNIAETDQETSYRVVEASGPVQDQ